MLIQVAILNVPQLLHSAGSSYEDTPYDAHTLPLLPSVHGDPPVKHFYCLNFLALLALLRCSRSTHLSLTALLVCKDLHGCISHKCHCGMISSCWLAMLLLLAQAERHEGNVSWCWPLPAGKAIFMSVCKSKCIVSAVCEIQCNIEQCWKKNEKWPAAIAGCLCWNILCHFEKRVPTLVCAIQMQWHFMQKNGAPVYVFKN